MPDSDRTAGYVPNPYYTQKDWDEVSSPELTDEELARMRPAAEVLPELVAALQRHQNERQSSGEVVDSLRVDRDVIEAYRATGPDWQRRMNEALRRSIGR